MRIILKQHRGKTAPGFKHDARLKTDVHKIREKKNFVVFFVGQIQAPNSPPETFKFVTDKRGIHDKEPSCVFIIRSSFTARFESEQQPPTAC